MIGLTLLLLPLLAGAAYLCFLWMEWAITFHPERYSPGPDWSLPDGAEDVWLTTADGLRLHGWFLQSSSKPATATIIYFHGNAGNISYLRWLGQDLAQSGFDVLLLDYRGYGRSEGKVRGEQGIYADADAAYNYVVNSRGVNPQRLVLYGQSLGTAAVVDVASRKQCGAIILESGLSSAADFAAFALPLLPRWIHNLGRNRFESARKLARVQCPVLITHGQPDNTMDTRHAHALFAAANEPKRLLLVPGADHNVFGSGGDKYLGAIAVFIREAVGF
ncbi:MAG: alpha/beta hydrolase [Acidobacteriota bacterium]